MPRKRTWLFVVAAALLLWLRPWRRLARRLRGAAQDPAGTPHPEAAFTGVDAPAPAAEPIGAVLDRGAPALERAASDQAAALGETGPGPDEAEFAGPAFFGPGDAAEGEPDLIDSMLALDDEPDADAIMALDDEPDALSAGLTAGEAEGAGAIPAGYLNLSADAPGALVAGPAAEGAGEVAMLEAEVGAEEPRRPDDLLVIEGIGPRTSTIVTAAGITSFAQLAAADVENLRAALVDAGIKTVDPSTWPEQARLAADGRWDELQELQGRIKNGRKQ